MQWGQQGVVIDGGVFFADGREGRTRMATVSWVRCLGHGCRRSGYVHPHSHLFFVSVAGHVCTDGHCRCMRAHGPIILNPNVYTWLRGLHRCCDLCIWVTDFVKSTHSPMGIT